MRNQCDKHSVTSMLIRARLRILVSRSPLQLGRRRHKQNMHGAASLAGIHPSAPKLTSLKMTLLLPG